MKNIVSVLVALFVLTGPLSAMPALAASGQADAKPTDAELDAAAAQARQRIVEIVNQPVTHLPRTNEAAMFSPGWFHEGALKPDFDTVDVRASQQMPYTSYTYVTSDLNPSEMFVASELEFNDMTKYFYTDRSVPKKRLSQEEMLEINSLYRVIGRDEQSLSARRTMTWAAVLASILAVSLSLLFGRTLLQSVGAIFKPRAAPIGLGGRARRA